jgi:hypothetical protein
MWNRGPVTPVSFYIGLFGGCKKLRVVREEGTQ